MHTQLLACCLNLMSYKDIIPEGDGHVKENKRTTFSGNFNDTWEDGKVLAC